MLKHPEKVKTKTLGTFPLESDLSDPKQDSQGKILHITFFGLVLASLWCQRMEKLKMIDV